MKRRSVPRTGGRLRFDQPINLPSGEDYLYIAVWDTATGRLGTLQLSLQVEKPK